MKELNETQAGVNFRGKEGVNKDREMLYDKMKY